MLPNNLRTLELFLFAGYRIANLFDWHILALDHKIKVMISAVFFRGASRKYAAGLREKTSLLNIMTWLDPLKLSTWSSSCKGRGFSRALVHCNLCAVPPWNTFKHEMVVSLPGRSTKQKLGAIWPRLFLDFVLRVHVFKWEQHIICLTNLDPYSYTGMNGFPLSVAANDFPPSLIARPDIHENVSLTSRLC